MRSLSASWLEAWSRRRGEPGWLRARRLEAFSALQEGPAPLSEADAGAVRQAMELPVAAAAALSADLAAQGLELLSLGEAVARSPEKVRPWLGLLAEPRLEASWALNAACWVSGLFISVPPGIRAAVPLQVSVGLSGGGALERTLIVVGEGAELRYIEGCSEPVGASGKRWSVIEAFAGPGAKLSAATLQSWPDGVDSDASKLGRAEKGASVEWVDGNLGGRVVLKRLLIQLRGHGARGRALVAGFAGPGQGQRLSAAVDPGAAGRAGEAETLAARSSGGSIETFSPKDSRQRAWRAEDMPAEQLFYLEARGLSPAQARAASLHAFFEPLARELPLEFSVEWTRLLDAQSEGNLD